MPNVQWKNRDDWQRSYPTHVEFLDKNKFGKISGYVGFIKKKFVTMHGHMNVKFVTMHGHMNVKFVTMYGHMNIKFVTMPGHMNLKMW